MTNLLEKSLLIGFGIFTLMIFASVIIPFFNQIMQYNENQREELKNYLEFIDEIDYSVNFVIYNPSQIYIKNIAYPENLNLTVRESSLEYNFILGDILNTEIEQYTVNFYPCSYHNLPSGLYNLNVSFQNFLITIILKKN